MKKTLTLVMLFTMATVSSLFAQEKNIKVIDKLPIYSAQGLDMALGSDRYTIDSLVLNVFPSMEQDKCFSLLRDCCEKGRLTGIDMRRCKHARDIPEMAFMPSVINGKPRKTDGDDEKNTARTNLRYITLSANTDKIGDYAFAHTNLEAITIPYLTKVIGNGAFDGCDYLKDVAFIGNKVKSDDAGYAFFGLADGAVLHVAEELADSYRGKECWSAFGDVRERSDLYNMMDITLDGSHTLEEMTQGQILFVDSMALSGPMTKEDVDYLRDNNNGGRLKNLDLSDCVIECENGLFGCRFDNLRMPKQMKKITYCFLQLSMVDNLTMPESYEEMAVAAFEKYKWFADSTLVIPEGCRKLSYRAFLHCTSIKTLYLPSTLEVLEPSSLGFSLWREWEGLAMDIYVNRMYPPTSTQTREDDVNDPEVDSASENGPFGCQEHYKETAGCLTRNMRLFVPVGAKKNYETAEHWDHFRTIIETPMLTGTPDGIVETVMSVKPAASAADGIYTVDGRLVTRDMAAKSSLRGLYIVREGGLTRKVTF